MKTVRYQNRNAIFDFEFPDVIERVKYYSDQKAHEATEILDSIVSSPSQLIKVETNYFGYIVLDLIKAGKGHAYCNTCQKMYDSNQLTSRPLGFGRSPFEVNFKEKGGIIKRLFGRPKHISGMGGDAYDCPKGHQLIAMITWIS